MAQLRSWWDRIVALGSGYGYFANPSKTWLVVKPEYHMLAVDIFNGTGVNITAEGKRYLGSAVGSR